MIGRILILLLSVLTFFGTQTFAESGREYYEKGLEAYKNDEPLKALHYFSWACDEGYSDGCARKRLIENSPLDSTLNITKPTNNTHSLPYDEVKKIFEYALEQYNAKNYSKSFPLFLKLCTENKDYPSCLWLGRSYAFGYGTGKNPMAALDIFRDNRNKHEAFRLEEAELREYSIGGDDDINNAMNMYNELKNSKVEWIANAAKEGLGRLPTYIFLNELLPVQGAYLRNKINYDTLYERLHNIDTKYISPDLREQFYVMRESCLKVAKNNENYWKEAIGNSATTFFKTLAGGVSGIVEGVIEGFSIGNRMADDGDICIQRNKAFANAMSRETISGAWLENKIKTHYPQKN